jgi:cyanophycinase-like exopeptidase
MRFFFLLLLSLVSLEPLFAGPGVVVLAGGEAEGNIGVTTDWSYPLYKRLVDNGDKTGDRKIKVVVLSLDAPSSNFMVDYFKSMGADTSQNLVVNSKEASNDPKVTEVLSDADVVFIRGGNQAKAYQYWKGSKVENELKKLGDRSGAIGGTSSGAMGLSQYTMTGGKDYDSKEILSDSHSLLLNDEINVMKSGIHNDFLNMAPGIMADTHCGERGRVGRLMGVMAKTIDDYKDKKLVAICLEERTGIAIENGKAKVYGTGGVHFLSETRETKKERIPGKPLSYINVRNDFLTDGWEYSFSEREPDLKSAPKDTKELVPNIGCGSVNKHLNHKSSSGPLLKITTPLFSRGLAIFDGSYSDVPLMNGDLKKGIVQTLGFDTLAKDPDESVIMLDSPSELVGLENNLITVKTPNAASAIILDCQNCTHTSKSPFVAFLDSGNKSLHTSALVNLRLHALSTNDTYNVETHEATLARDNENCKPLTNIPEDLEKIYKIKCLLKK